MAVNCASWCAAAFFLAVTCSSSPAVLAAETGISQPLFAKNTPLELDLDFDFDKVCHDPTSVKCEDLPATISYSDDVGLRVRMNVKLRTRGRWRRQTGGCDLPALFVYLDPAQTRGTVFENQTKLPFTTHCRHAEKKYQRYTMLEYMAYRYYNLLTDASLKVRLTHATFRDTGGSTVLRRYGFFSEHFQNAAARMDAELIDVESLDPREADAMDMATLALFQYMIGNLDWSVVKSHNIALFRRENGKVTALPFDFDFSGLVDTEYAVPPESVRIYNIRVRKYRGFCWPGLDWEALFDRFLANRAEMIELMGSLPAVDSAGRIATRRYIRDFFATIESTKARKREITDACRELPSSTSN